MPGNPRGLRRGALILSDPPDLLGLAADGCKIRGVVQVGLPGIQGGDTWVIAVLHHLQCGGGCGGEALGRGGGRGHGQAGRARTGGQTPK